tara:strand:+ start:25 stop:1134 length:1110 start_codon:yes stop_codon:yes gene_type:complete
MHYYIISGEPSGDLYGSKLIKSLQNIDTNAQFTCWGGSHMQNAGGDIVISLESLSYMGFYEVVKNSLLILKNLMFAKKHIKKINPHAIILIDYPGFNLKIAEYANKMNIPVFWFVAPQVWAWRKSRVKQMKKYIDKLFVALPFELDYFKKEGIDTFYFGHPMIDIIGNISQKKNNPLLGKPVIALLPGSRIQEVRKLLPVMLKSSVSFNDYRFVVVCVDHIKRSFYEDLIQNYNIELVFNQNILKTAKLAIVSSGTATLELAIYNIPQVVCYKLNILSYLIAKFVVRIKHISLVNILAKQPFVDELIQDQCNVKNLEIAISKLLDSNNRKKMILNYQHLMKKLGPSDCFLKTANTIFNHLDGIKKHPNI